MILTTELPTHENDKVRSFLNVLKTHLRGFEPPTFGLGRHCSIQAELQVHSKSAGGRNRTYEGTKPRDFESLSFDRFDTPA